MVVDSRHRDSHRHGLSPQIRLLALSLRLAHPIMQA